MSTLVIAADDGGCGQYRALLPARAARAAGYDVDVFVRDGRQQLEFDAGPCPFGCVFREVGDGTTALVALTGEARHDTVVLQRPLTRGMSDMVRLLQAQGKRVLVELDDDFEHIPPDNVSWSAVHPAHSPNSNHLWLRRAIADADGLICSTPGIAETYVRWQSSITVVPNTVLESYLTIEPSHVWKGAPRLGWTGSVLTHRDDVRQTQGAVADILRATGGEFYVVGTGRGVVQAFGIGKPVQACGWLPFHAYAQAFRDAMEVLIAPLMLNRFNDAGKSWLKPLEAAALGIPSVCSPTREYLELERRLDYPLTVRRNRRSDWVRGIYSALERTGDGAELRRRVVAGGLTTEQLVDDWAAAWKARSVAVV